MKIILSGIFILISCYTNAQSQLSDREKAVQQSIIQMFQALSDLDTAALNDFFLEDALLLENGEVWNLDSLKIRIIKNKDIKDFSRKNHLHFLGTEVNENMAWVIYNNHAEIIRNGMTGIVTWLESAILIKDGERWKIKVLHSTLMKRS